MKEFCLKIISFRKTCVKGSKVVIITGALVGSMLFGIVEPGLSPIPKPPIVTLQPKVSNPYSNCKGSAVKLNTQKKDKIFYIKEREILPLILLTDERVSKNRDLFRLMEEVDRPDRFYRFFWSDDFDIFNVRRFCSTAFNEYRVGNSEAL